VIKPENVAAIVCLALCGCSEAAPETGAAAQLSQCVEGWWQDPAPSACSCPGGAQCAADDCTARRVIGFFADHTSYTGIVQMSEQAQRAGSSAAMSEGTWSIDEGAVRVQPVNAAAYSAEASCTQSELVFNHVRKVRVPEWATADLAAAVAEKGGR
jgi:hypothetical protein